MRKNRKFLITKIVLIAAVVPFIIHAYEYGPPPGYTGAPGDNKTGCIASGCHVGTANTGPGSVKILLPSGSAPTTYTPGQAMTLLVQITDSTKGAYGFQMTARSGTGFTTQAGDFTTTDANTQVFCPDGSTKANGSVCDARFPIEYIEHTLPGYTASMTGKGSYSYSFTWTPPATAVGNITLYVAGNAGLAGPPVVSPTNVYISGSTVLTPTAGVTPPPSITKNGVVPVYSPATTIQATSWISIYGTNLATSTALWTGNFPTTLGGASVTVDGKPGYLYYASPTQINLQAPSDTNTGSVNVVVTTPGGTSTSTVTLGQYGPSFSLLDATHVAGIILRPKGNGAYGSGANSYDIVGPTGSSLGYKTVAATAGDSLVLFGVGFGPTNPVVAAGAAYSGAAPITGTLTLSMNNKTVTPAFAGLTSAGLYQFNITVPAGLGTGDVPLSALIGGVTSPTGVVVSLQ